MTDLQAASQASIVEQQAKEIEILKRRLLEAQKLTAMGELVSTTTHEFNNVLMSVINYARMGLRHHDEQTRNNCFEKIAAAGERAAKITTGVLAMAKNRGNRMEPTDLAKIVDDTLVLLEREMRKYRIDVDFQNQDVPAALANGNQVQQVLLNLMINARQAMPQGGRLILRLSYDAADHMVDLLVRDHGVGIPSDQLPQIFDAFYSTKSGPDETGKGGTGIGLAACRDIVEAHQGKIRVQSTVGMGTAFTIRIPAAELNPNGQPDVSHVVPVSGGSMLPTSSVRQ
ncbi:sensor histidine kinase [Blastopirellula marina]|uniref:histidine kinase n=1 Tax=Blastopirellula marina TaxID=124 RepID=A0A2S8FCR3_9BACT|nr:ATP-binding protein [Blastopirellula marina]PQO29966.1 two-component sensor histidine kinase [Blastopirellula marina]PTL42434.1 two-component sensor histidine kinase [Blastopirellula marina]